MPGVSWRRCVLLPAPGFWVDPDPRRGGCTPRQKVTGTSAPKVAERYPSWEAWPSLEAGLTAGMRRGLRLGENLEIDSVPPVQTGSPRCFGAFWRSLRQVGSGGSIGQGTRGCSRGAGLGRNRSLVQGWGRYAGGHGQGQGATGVGGGAEGCGAANG